MKSSEAHEAVRILHFLGFTVVSYIRLVQSSYFAYKKTCLVTFQQPDDLSMSYAAPPMSCDASILTYAAPLISYAATLMSHSASNKLRRTPNELRRSPN